MTSLQTAADPQDPPRSGPRVPGPKIKCVVWDLDNTLWQGTLLENDRPELKPDALRVIAALDARGVLHSIASRNDPALALAALERFGLTDQFLYPQIHWGSKADSLREIARLLDIGLDSLAFVDDDARERAEVGYFLPEVRCVDAAEAGALLERRDVLPRFITAESRGRRRMYLDAQARRRSEQEFAGSRADFLASLGMVFTIAAAEESDLRRAEELTERTHQFNSTGHAFSYDELEVFRTSGHHLLLLGTLEDSIGSYGHVSLVLVEQDAEGWTIKLLLASCRVLSTGVALLLLNHVRAEARRRGIRLRAEFVPNEKNILMSVTYKFAGFTEVAREGGVVLFEDSRAEVDPVPGHVRVIVQSTSSVSAKGGEDS